ncbi:MAG: hypothetical protein LJE93_01170 [Acidobacteria bacterium]|nr:hypothetical protein [Acidobacteriota bacterium]
MRVQGKYLQCFVLPVMLAVALPAGGQALFSEYLGNGTELLVVTQPLTDATTIIWPVVENGRNVSKAVVSGDLTLVDTLESALALEQATTVPPVVIAVGGVSVPDLRTLLDRIIDGRPPYSISQSPETPVVEGRVERRLGAPGTEAQIRLEVNLPSPSDPKRSSIEVLWDVLPDVLANGDLSGVRSRVEGNRALLEAQADSSSADLASVRLRRGIARFAENPAVQEERVDASAQSLRVRRQALLEEHPDAAELLLELWLSSGTPAVREFLFGVDGVTLQTVRAAAMAWLPQHPGSILITLPPRSFNPRFAAPPVTMQLENGLSAIALGRSGLSLAALCMRPVVIPDLDEEVAATVLARLARELRESEQRPGWVRVDVEPPQILIAAPVEQFSELTEALRFASAQAEGDNRPVMPGGGSARRRALRLMAGTLGVAEGSSLSPSTLLASGNLALGIVAEDAEAASEAIRKFWAGETSRVSSAAVGQIAAVPKTREAAAGSDSVLVAALEFPAMLDESLVLVMAELLEARGTELLAEGSIEVLQPFVPGHRVLLVVAEAQAGLDELEAALQDIWPRMTASATEDELNPVQRRAAATSAAAWSGTTGQACRCAAVASGAARWRPATDLELAILSIAPEEINAALESVSIWGQLPNTGAGVLPIVELDDR